MGFLTISDYDTSVTNIKLDKFGTTISIWESIDNYSNGIEADYISPPTLCDTCSSIVDVRFKPGKNVGGPKVKVDGRGELRANKALGATFRVTIPFALQLEPMVFMGGTATKIEAFEHDTRSKLEKV